MNLGKEKNVRLQHSNEAHDVSILQIELHKTAEEISGLKRELEKRTKEIDIYKAKRSQLTDKIVDIFNLEWFEGAS